jgi:hypothetical protein
VVCKVFRRENKQVSGKVDSVLKDHIFNVIHCNILQYSHSLYEANVGFLKQDNKCGSANGRLLEEETYAAADRYATTPAALHNLSEWLWKKGATGSTSEWFCTL